jgi:hypothetical protein
METSVAPVNTEKKVVIRGQVSKPILYPKNGSDVRCVFDLMLVVKIGNQSCYQGVRFRVVGDPSITEKCKKFVEEGVRLTVVGKVDAANVHAAGTQKIWAVDLFTDKLAI